MGRDREIEQIGSQKGMGGRDRQAGKAVKRQGDEADRQNRLGEAGRQAGQVGRGRISMCERERRKVVCTLGAGDLTEFTAARISVHSIYSSQKKVSLHSLLEKTHLP